MSKILRFEALPGTFKKTLEPMINSVPDWYRKIERFYNVDNEKYATVKHCMPFLDALTTGYSIALGKDVYVTQTLHGPFINYKDLPSPVGNRAPGATGKMPAPEGYDEEHLVWQTQTAFILPEGYSAIFTHPLNRFDLPFITLSGVVDGEMNVHAGNIPFYIKKGFEGLIPAGTPIIQVIPFLREDWKSKPEKGLWNESLLNTSSDDYKEGRWYLRRKHHRKSYK
jgi:hypothetical protein